MTTQMLAVHLQDLVPEARQTNIADAMVKGLQVDSRKVQPGDCFLAFPGHAVDGREYIKDALARGAVAVVAEAQGLQQAGELPIVAVDNLQRRLEEIAGRFIVIPQQQCHW
ncbi:MAG: Mur ligase domain-containing protein [Gammaproteobacteria bacterium]